MNPAHIWLYGIPPAAVILAIVFAHELDIDVTDRADMLEPCFWGIIAGIIWPGVLVVAVIAGVVALLSLAVSLGISTLAKWYRRIGQRAGGGAIQ